MALKRYINQKVGSKTEVELFKLMIDYFQRAPFAHVIHKVKETHHHDVLYSPIPPYDKKWGKQIEKEISDVFFMVVSNKRHIARMTHLQAKLEKKKRPNQSFSFTLDAGQYLMLHNRLDIIDPQRVYPRDIFSNPLYTDSVASYGVFYKDNQQNYDMAFEIASLITYNNQKLYRSKDSQLVHSFATVDDFWGVCNKRYDNAFWRRYIKKFNPFYAPYPYYYHYYNAPELLSTTSLDTFERELLNAKIGTRVDFDIKLMNCFTNIFSQNANANNLYTSFIQGQELFLRAYGLLEEIDILFRILAETGNKPPHDFEDMGHFNPENISGTYILIDADSANFDYIPNKRD